MNHLLRIRAPGVFAGLLCGAVACGGYSSSSPAGDAPRLKLASSARVGNYLVDGNGRSLYYFGQDLPATADKAAVSNCSDACVAAWPIFHADKLIVEGISAGDVGEITRSDGGKQTTFRGWPLYFFAGDAKAGDLAGEGVADVWFVLRDQPYSIVLMSNAPGSEPVPYMSDGTGRSLYYFFHDTKGTASAAPVSACTTATCLGNFPVFVADVEVVPSSLASADFTVFTRPDGQRQSAYKGQPLYFFSGDAAAGDTKGRGFNSVWSTLNPTNAP